MGSGNKDDAEYCKSSRKGKESICRTEIKGKKLGVIGLGAIGQFLLPMQPLHWVWKFTVMIRIFQSMLHGICQARLRILSM